MPRGPAVFFQVRSFSVISSFSLVPAIQAHHSGAQGWDIASRRHSGGSSAVAACGGCSCQWLRTGFKLSSPRGTVGRAIVGCWVHRGCAGCVQAAARLVRSAVWCCIPRLGGAQWSGASGCAALPVLRARALPVCVVMVGPAGWGARRPAGRPSPPAARWQAAPPGAPPAAGGWRAARRPAGRYPLPVTSRPPFKPELAAAHAGPARPAAARTRRTPPWHLAPRRSPLGVCPTRSRRGPCRPRRRLLGRNRLTS